MSEAASSRIDLLGGQTPKPWDNPVMLVTMDAKRRLTVPTNLAPASPGDRFESWFDAEEDEIVFRKLKPDGDWLAILGECPVPIDDLPPRRMQTAKSHLSLDAPHRNHPDPFPSP